MFENSGVIFQVVQKVLVHVIIISRSNCLRANIQHYLRILFMQCEILCGYWNIGKLQIMEYFLEFLLHMAGVFFVRRITFPGFGHIRNWCKTVTSHPSHKNEKL